MSQESQLVKDLNAYMKNKGIAYRLKQSRFITQIVDVLVDSPVHGYLCCECKSTKYKNAYKIYFSSNFKNTKTGHQVTNISRFVKLSGRKAFLIVELRFGRGKRNSYYKIPWEVVQKRFKAKKKFVPLFKKWKITHAKEILK